MRNRRNGTEEILKSIEASSDLPSISLEGLMAEDSTEEESH
jgi:uncharacterized pyridoxal phosphate-containing UPF0001 family protein